MKRALLIVIAVITLWMSAPLASARYRVTPNTLDSLERLLKKARTPADSLPVLYDLFDVLSLTTARKDNRERCVEILDQIYETGGRAGRTDLQFDALRNKASVARKDYPLLNDLLKKTRLLPKSNDRRETEIFIKSHLDILASRDTTKTATERSERLLKLALANDSAQDDLDIYTRIDHLFTLSIYAGPMVEPVKLTSYLKRLEQLMDHIKSPNMALRSMFHIEASKIYNDMGMYRNSVESDRKLLQIMRHMEERNDTIGREFKDYDRQYYIIYRRMISNYPELSNAEVENYHKLLLETAARLPEGELSQSDRDMPQAMYLLYKGKYTEALPLLRHLVQNTRFGLAPRLVDAYLNAARKTGSKDDIIIALDSKMALISNETETAIADNFARLSQTFALNEMSDRNAHLENQNALMAEHARRDVVEARHRTQIIVLIVAGVMLIIIMIIMVINNRRRMRTAAELSEVNRSLMAERDAMARTERQLTEARDRASDANRQKSEFIDNISHEITEPVKTILGYTQLIVDSIDEDKREYLSRFINIVETNCQILQRIVNDILEAAESENSPTNVTIQNIDPAKLTDLITSGFADRVRPGQRLVNTPLQVITDLPNDNATIDSDPERIDQIMVNLLTNAIKFADNGDITIESILDRNNGLMTFIVSDHGPGIPEGREEDVFTRFEKLGRFSTGLGLGLPVSRAFARQLGGDLRVDTSYREGARFILTIPITPSKKAVSNNQKAAE